MNDLPTLHLHIVDEANLHIPKASVIAKGAAGSSAVDFAGDSGSDGTVSVDLGALTTGSVVVAVDVNKDGKTAQLSIVDTVAPLIRPDISYTVVVPGAKGSRIAQLLAELEATMGDVGGPIVVGAGAVALGIVYLASQRKRKEAEQMQQMMMMMAMSRAPQEVASTHLANGVKAAKSSARKSLKAVAMKALPAGKVLKATVRKVVKK